MLADRLKNKSVLRSLRNTPLNQLRCVSGVPLRGDAAPRARAIWDQTTHVKTG
jgi:hypothetical protein